MSNRFVSGVNVGTLNPNLRSNTWSMFTQRPFLRSQACWAFVYIPKCYYSRATVIRTYQVSLGYLMILGFHWVSLVFFVLPGPFKALVSYRPVLMAVAWL